MLARTLWRILPRQFRQSLYGEISGFSLSAVEPSWAPFHPPFTVVGPLRSPTGLGQAARLAFHAIQSAGLTCSIVDVTSALRQPATEACLVGAPLETGSGTLLVFSPPPNAAQALRQVPRSLRAEKHLVGCWVCETINLPNIWLRQSRFFHSLTAPTNFCAASIGRATGRPVILLGHPVDAEPLPPVPDLSRRLGHRPVIGAVLDVSSSATRKDVKGLAEALLLIVSEAPEVELQLKIREVDVDPSVAATLHKLQRLAPERIAVITKNLSRKETITFLDGIDILLSMSRSEGFGLPFAEAIMRGVMVAAPRWAGAAELLSDANSIALPFTLTPIRDTSGLYPQSAGKWADVQPRVAADAVLCFLRSRREHIVHLPLPELATSTDFQRRLFTLY